MAQRNVNVRTCHILMTHIFKHRVWQNVMSQTFSYSSIPCTSEDDSNVTL